MATNQYLKKVKKCNKKLITFEKKKKNISINEIDLGKQNSKNYLESFTVNKGRKRL